MGSGGAPERSPERSPERRAHKDDGVGSTLRERHRRVRSERDGHQLDRRLATAYASWKRVSVGQALLRRHVVRALVARRAQCLTRSLLAAWRATALERRRARLCATQHHCYGAQRRAWDGWLRIQARKRLVNYKLATHLLGRWTQTRLQAATDGWVSYAQARKHKRLAGQHMRRFIGRRCAQRVFRAWLTESMGLPPAMRDMVLRFLLRSWRRVAARAVYARSQLGARMTRLLVHRAENIVRRTLRGWRTVVASGQQKRREMTRKEVAIAHVLRRLDNVKVAAAFGTWAETAFEQRRRKCAAEKEKARQDAVCAKILTRMVKRGMAHSFTSWADYAVYRRVTRMKISKRVAAMAKDRMQLTLWQWSETVKEKRANEHRVKKLLGRLLGEKKTVCFCSWSDFVTEQKNDRTKVLRHLLNRGLSAAFATWAMMVADAIAEREDDKWKARQDAVCAKILARMVKRGMAQSFTSWADYAVYRRVTRMKISKRVVRMTVQRLCLCFESWCGFVLDQKSDRTNITKHLMNRNLSTGFATWAMVVADSIAWRAINKAAGQQLAAKGTRTLSTCFNRWAGLTLAQRDRFASLVFLAAPQPLSVADEWAAIALRTNSSNLIRCSSMTLSDLSLPPSNAARPVALFDAATGSATSTISAADYSRARAHACPTQLARPSLAGLPWHRA